MENNDKKQFEIKENLLANRGQRFVHYLIDNIAIYTIIFGVFFVMAVAAEIFGSPGLIDTLDEFNDLQWYAVYFAFMISYYTLFEFYFSRTPAKFITNTIVVMEDGSKPELSTIFKRTLCRIIPFDPLSFLGSSGRGWHDNIMDVYVVKKKAFEYNYELFNSFEEIGKGTTE